MSTAARLVAFVLGLGAVFGLALGAGALAGPIQVAAAEPEHAPDDPDGAGGHGAAEEGGHEASAVPAGGLAVADRGYRLVTTSSVATAGTYPLSFSVEGPDGEPVQEYDVEHEKRLHLIVVRRDLTGYQHVHPELGPDGTWTIDLDLAPGSWRVIADFVPSELGGKVSLGTDLTVPGAVEAAPLPDAATTTTVDGYDVAVDGHLEPGSEQRLTFAVSRDGEPVTDLEPYLGASAHLVALRAGDLAYLHVHPADDGPDDGAAFLATAPSAGTYRLFLDFQHDGVVRTAEVTVDAGGDHG
jgi:hypothetical protein